MNIRLNYPDHSSLENTFGYNRNSENRRDGHQVTLEEGEDEMIIAKCAEINVITQGKSWDDAEKNIVKAISLMREELGKYKEFSILVKRIFV